MMYPFPILCMLRYYQMEERSGFFTSVSCFCAHPAKEMKSEQR